MKRTTNITHVAFALFALVVAISSEAEIKTGPYAINVTPTSDHSLGLKQVLFIRTQFPDVATSKTQADCQTVMEQVRRLYFNSSYGRTDMNVTVTAVAYMMPHPSSYYVTQSTGDGCYTALMNDAVAAASADYPVDQTGGSYDFVGDYYPGIPSVPGAKSSGSQGSFGTKWFWISEGGTLQGLYRGLIAHEMGHAYGSRHASLWQTSDGDPVGAAGKIVEYGDTYDLMGAATGYTQPYIDFNPWVKWHFGWIDDAQVAIVTAPGTYQFRIFRFDSAASTGLLSIKIPRDDGSNYWIAVRRNWITKPLEMTGAYIIWGYDVVYNYSALIDCNTPGSNISDSALQVGQTLNDAPHGITITPLAIGGSDPNQYMDVQVTRQPTPTPTETPTPSPTPTPTPTPNVQITIQTNPAGRSFTVDGSSYSSTQAFSWASGSTHTIATTSPQSGGTSIQYVWKSWSDSGQISHTIASTSNKTYTATFTTQYYLTMSAGTGGTVSPVSGWKNSGAVVSISETPTKNASGSYNFNGWTGTGSGSYSGTNNPASITMNGPITEAAFFSQNPVQVTIQTSPVGRSFSVDGTAYSSTQTFSWQPGSSHTIATTSPQSGSTGAQYVWANWTDSGAISHSVAPTTNKTYTAKFNTQYFLTMAAGVGGTVTPASGWKASGSSVKITATPKTGYSFTDWSGTGASSFSGTTNSVNITMSGPVGETASFTRNSSPTPTLTPTPTPMPNQSPVAVVGGPYSGIEGIAIQFDGSGSQDPDGTIASYDWDFNDGGPHGSGVNPTHVFAAPGSYAVSLVVTDNLGAQSSPSTTDVFVSQ